MSEHVGDSGVPLVQEPSFLALFTQAIGAFLLFLVGSILVFAVAAFVGFFVFAFASRNFKYGLYTLPLFFIVSCFLCGWLYRIAVRRWRSRFAHDEHVTVRIGRIAGSVLGLVIFLFFWIALIGG
jgi:hypothetical protein